MEKFTHSSQALAILIVYLIIMIGIGWYASKRIKGTTDFIVAGRRLPLWLSVGTLVATWFCGGAVMGATSEAYSWGLQGIIWDPLSSVPAFILVGFVFVRMFRRARYLTPADMFTSRFGKAAGVANAVVVSLFAELIWLGSVLVAFGAVISMFTGISLAMSIVIASVVTAIYTYMGGMWAVSLTDFIQMVLLIAGILIVFPAAINAVGGWGPFVANAGNVEGLPPFAMWPVGGEAGYVYYTGIEGWMYYAVAWASIGLAGTVAAQDFWQRILAAKNEKTAVRTCWITSGIYLVFGMMCPLIGIAAWEINPTFTGAAVEQIFPWMATTLLSPYLAIFVSVGLIAALMSSGDSAALAAASLWGRNIQLAIRPKATDKQMLSWTRAMVPVAILVAALIALIAQTIYWLMCMAYALTLVVLFVPTALGIFWKKYNNYGCWSYIIASIAFEVGLTVHYLPVYGIDDASYMVAIPTILISLVISIVVTLLTQQADPPKPFADVDGNPLPVKNWLGSWNAVDGG